MIEDVKIRIQKFFNSCTIAIVGPSHFSGMDINKYGIILLTSVIIYYAGKVECYLEHILL